ncbi:uncharacterized PE-PGRS family protein PE_PGRS3-like isoform X2 [Rhipicephalus sanguineus]|uniref:uncharacterized PE-PGRS family protein PE_PGRS3-like isoform X2 n=1 Tax=Rhipicephalus sanguineus TaxID=34632 RepID=UPI001895758F|nr:uncharacterized PE-PGRS family protein PE_PGRS3-like isoform X2 [Rhipicephalus sanguineus]
MEAVGLKSIVIVALVLSRVNHATRARGDNPLEAMEDGVFMARVADKGFPGLLEPGRNAGAGFGASSFGFEIEPGGLGVPGGLGGLAGLGGQGGPSFGASFPGGAGNLGPYGPGLHGGPLGGAIGGGGYVGSQSGLGGNEYIRGISSDIQRRRQAWRTEKWLRKQEREQRRQLRNEQWLSRQLRRMERKEQRRREKAERKLEKQAKRIVATAGAENVKRGTLGLGAGTGLPEGASVA